MAGGTPHPRRGGNGARCCAGPWAAAPITGGSPPPGGRQPAPATASEDDVGGGGGIRTHGGSRHGGFQDRCIRPLCHPSAARVSYRLPHLTPSHRGSFL